ncbi:MAG TPA: serine hydrolase domain-containing protein [Solirubrobacter sp.]|nr:serine hydrolase domain-containing protein [Solirubrobacter sp.]
MHPRRPATALFAAAGLATAVPATAHAAGLRTAVRAAHDAGAPGVVALAGRRVRAAGSARVGGHRRLNARTPIRIGSVTKSFTATVALQLVGERRLSLSDTVGELLPGTLPIADPVTLRELLNHTSGLPDDVLTPLRRVLAGDRTHIWTRAELLDAVRDMPLRFPPGTRYGYSNTDFLLVGMIVERITHHSLRTELRARILRPLHLRDTRFPVAATRLPGPAHGYSLTLDGSKRLDVTDYSPSFAWASGNGVSTLRDLARFQRALLDGRLLKPRIRRAMLTGVPTGHRGRRSGLGVELVRTRHGLRVGHDGDILGFSTKVLTDTRGRRPAIVAANLKLAPPAVEDALDAAEAAAVRAASRRL